MEEFKITTKDDVVMKLLHYFITEEDYRPIILRGINNEIWLENLDSDLKIIRINTGHLHNNAQLEIDIKRTKSIMKNIQKKTLSLNMNMLNIIIDAGENVSNIEEKGIETIKVSKISDIKKNKIVNTLFPKIKNVPTGKVDSVTMMALTEEINQKTIKEERKLSKIFEIKKPIITSALIAINIIIFILMLNPSIYHYMVYNFGNYYEAVASGQVYRLITSGFLHDGFVHIAFNMYALSIVGKEIERYYGKTKYLLIYFISMIIGSLFACVFTNSFGIGASGAIFGLFGSLLYFSFSYRATLDGLLHSPIMPTIVINIILGFMIPNVSVSAHIGGLLGGFLTSMAVGIESKKNKSEKINAIIVLLIMIIFLSFMLLTK